jgi:predicted transcriptional regulator
MEVMWAMEQATVRQVLNVLRERRTIAYTTVMTILNNLATKGLLRRIPQGKAHLYSVALSRQEFWERASQEAVTEVLDRFGDLAIARFVEAVVKLRPEYLSRLRELAEQAPERVDKEVEVKE